MPHVHPSHQTVTVSVGVACTAPNDTQAPGDLIEAADAALYAAKHRGRNTVVEHGFVRLTDDGDRDGAGELSRARRGSFADTETAWPLPSAAPSH